MEEQSKYFENLEKEVDKNLENIWNDVIVPYIKKSYNEKILYLDEYDLCYFKEFFYENSKYYKYIEKNLIN